MRLQFGLLEGSLPYQGRLFAALDGQLLDLTIARAAFLKTQEHCPIAYESAAFGFQASVAEFLRRRDSSMDHLAETASWAARQGLSSLRGPNGEKAVYDPAEVRLLPPLPDPQKSIVIGFSDRARAAMLPQAAAPTGFYKLPQTFVTSGAPLVRPSFSEELDADGCLALVIGKAGKNIAPNRAWDYIAGVTLLIDVTARDINRAEGLTTNNLLGKNFRSSASVGPAVLLDRRPGELTALEVELTVDGTVRQRFRLRDCVFTVEQIIAHWSVLGIHPGDFFAIGASMSLDTERPQSPAPLQIGSEVRCYSAAIGELCHTVLSAKDAR